MPEIIITKATNDNYLLFTTEVKIDRAPGPTQYGQICLLPMCFTHPNNEYPLLNIAAILTHALAVFFIRKIYINNSRLARTPSSQREHKENARHRWAPRGVAAQSPLR